MACFDHAFVVRGGTVWRGDGNITPARFRAGSIDRFDDFTSTTHQRELAEEIAQHVTGVLLRIYLPAGARALDVGALRISGFDFEREVLLPPTEFVVAGISGNTVSLSAIVAPCARKRALRRAAKANRRSRFYPGGPGSTFPLSGGPDAQHTTFMADTGTLADKVARAAQMPLRYCLASKTLENGKGMVMLARGVPPHLAIGGFLIDLRVGIRDTYFRVDDEAAFKVQVDATGDLVPLISVDPDCVRKRLREVAAWATSKGFASHPDFPVLEQLFGTPA
jgi:hypothetical protein